MLQEVDFISRLETGPFGANANDDARARKLLSGKMKLGEDIVDVFVPNTFDRIDMYSRYRSIELHSLRRFDVLRRCAVDGAHDAWEQIFRSWQASAVAQDLNSLAWSPLALQQRSTSIALGAGESAPALDAIALHLEQLAKLVQSQVTVTERYAVLEIRVALQQRRGDRVEALRDTVVDSALEMFDGSGYGVAEDLEALAVTAKRLGQLLRDLEVDADDPVFSRVEGTQFWIQSLDPDGGPVELGNREALELPHADTASIQYVKTAGAAGVPPKEIRYSNTEGLLLLHSGWGETERDARAETFVSVVAGPMRGKASHQDLGRVTYASQGRRWLIDPMLEEASGSEAHSIVMIDGAKYRSAARASVGREYADTNLDGFVMNITTTSGVRWFRHVVFARTGNYLVIEDIVRASTLHVAHLQWIVSPDVEIERTVDGFVLRDGGKSVSLTVSATTSFDNSVGVLVDSNGEVYAQRIRVTFNEQSIRVVTIIADVVDYNNFEASQVSRSGNSFTLDITGKGLRETLVVTPEFSMIVKQGMDPEQAVANTVEFAAAGSLTPQEALEQRLAVRRAIEEVKETIWAAGDSSEARKAGIKALLLAGDELAVAGLRDHGYAAALVDIAGEDLYHLIADVPQVSKISRSALVQWGERELMQASYGVRVHTSRDAGSVPVVSKPAFIWTVDLGQLVLPSYIHEAPGEVLSVYFHGAIDRTRFSLPRYERLRSIPTLGLGPVMFFSDPSLDLDSRMILSWFAGNEEKDVHKEIARMINSYAAQKGIGRVVLVGNSGGGFTSLQVASHLKGSRVVSFAPQIQIDRYVPRLAENAQWAIFGRTSVADDPVNAQRMDLIKRYRAIDFDQEVVLIQNTGDDMHYKSHFLPFADAYNASANLELLQAHLPYLGPGHRVPIPAEYLEYIRQAVDSNRTWEFGGLRGL